MSAARTCLKMAKKTPEDPTGQARNRNRGTRALTVRLTKAERDVKAMFRAIPKKRRTQTQIVNTIIAVYDYAISGQELTDLQNSIRFTLNRELLETQTGLMQPDWYWKEHVELPYRQGTGEEVVRFNQLIASARAAGVKARGIPPEAVSLESVLLSEPYRQALDDVYASNFTSISNLSSETSAQVIQRVNAGIQAGDTPTAIAKDITERFDVARSKAQRIARTEVNKAYNDAKLNAVELVSERTGLRAGVIHISALVPSSRASHVARHGNVYTVAAQRQWWNTSPNRINCLCNTESVLIDSQGKVVQKEFQEEIKAERS